MQTARSTVCGSAVDYFAVDALDAFLGSVWGKMGMGDQERACEVVRLALAGALRACYIDEVHAWRMRCAFYFTASMCLMCLCCFTCPLKRPLYSSC